MNMKEFQRQYSLLEEFCQSLDEQQIGIHYDDSWHNHEALHGGLLLLFLYLSTYVDLPNMEHLTFIQNMAGKESPEEAMDLINLFEDRRDVYATLPDELIKVLAEYDSASGQDPYADIYINILEMSGRHFIEAAGSRTNQLIGKLNEYLAVQEHYIETVYVENIQG